MDYRSELDRLSQRAEFLRLEMVRGLTAAEDMAGLHEALDSIRKERLDLAMAENDYDFDAACRDLDASLSRASGLPENPHPTHAFEGASH